MSGKSMQSYLGLLRAVPEGAVPPSFITPPLLLLLVVAI
jgi:hypothetical protein